MLTIILAGLLSGCIHSERFQANLDYLRNLESKEVFQDGNGTYYRTTEPNGDCSVDYEQNWPFEGNSGFGNSFEQRAIDRRIEWLTDKYCPQE